MDKLNKICKDMITFILGDNNEKPKPKRRYKRRNKKAK